MDRATDIGPLWGQNTPDSAWTRFGIDAAYVVVYLNLGFDKSTAPNQNGSVKEAPVTIPNQKKHRTDALSQQRITSLCAPARTSTGERRPGGRADWMFLIFLLLFGSSQKEGDRWPDKTVEAKKHQSILLLIQYNPVIVNALLPAKVGCQIQIGPPVLAIPG